ncbi:MAG: ArsC/Spx/MgsR family protein [Kofleriaceae bacterium]
MRRQLEVPFDEVNLAKAAPSEAQVKAIVALAGSVAAVMNTRHATVKANGWVDKPPSVSEFAKAVAAEVNVLRRPIYIDGDTIIIGFDKPAYAKL